MFQHHYYKWQGRIFRQVKGGGIDLRATQALAQLVVHDFVQIFKKALADGGVNMRLIWSYVDYILLFGDRVPLGSKWVDKRLEWKVEWEQEDIARVKRGV